MWFQKVIIIGSAKIAYDCIKTLLPYKDVLELFIIENGDSKISSLTGIAVKNEIKIECLQKKESISSTILMESEGKNTLVVSANNRYIFPKEIISKRNITIINFHYSLLPRYRGQNIPSWVIWNNEKKTGITWHLVNEGIDCGDILIQKEIELDNNTRAYNIVKDGMILGARAFAEIIPSILDGNINGYSSLASCERIYFASELPANGVLTTSLTMEEMTRLLRAYDYGRIELISPLKMEIENNRYDIKCYRIEPTDVCCERHMDIVGNQLIIVENNIRINIEMREKI